MGKKRISLTLEEDLVEQVDSEAERKNLNRSQLVEDVLSDHFKRRGVETAVVLCGDPEMKSLEEYKGRTVIEHILDHLHGQGISRVVLLAGRNRSEIEKVLDEDYRGMELEYVTEDTPRGTAAALEHAEEKIDGQSFVLLNGHVITDVDLEEMLVVHREEDAVATMALTTVEDPSSYGVARLKGRRILGFEEKPSPGQEPSRLINAGTYVLEPGIFDRLDGDSLETVFEKFADEGELAGYIYGGEWTDIGD